MRHGDRLQRLGTTIEHLSRHWELQHSAAVAHPELSPRTSQGFTVAISREAGTPDQQVAQELGKRLGWQVYDHELLERIAQDMGVRATLLESVDERQQSWLLECVEAFLSAPEKSEWGRLVTESAYVRHLVETVLALGIHGECVIVGRGATFLLPKETTLRVRLVAPVKERIATLSRQLGISEKEAAGKIRTMDRERNDFVRDHFLKDPTDATQFDIVVNAGRWPTTTVTALIVDALHHLEALAVEKGSFGLVHEAPH
jgi:cytidylate kinase